MPSATWPSNHPNRPSTPLEAPGRGAELRETCPPLWREGMATTTLRVVPICRRFVRRLFFRLDRQTVVFVEPSAQVDTLAARATKRHRRRFGRFKDSIADWAADKCHESTRKSRQAQARS